MSYLAVVQEPSVFQESARFREAIRRFDEANALDPTREMDRDLERPRELLYAERLYNWVLRLKPDASEPLRLAARSQHIRRWEVPRESFPMTREGYLKWRESLKHRHAEVSAAILRKGGYPEEIIERVQALNLKRNLKEDADCQTLEDALCLVFLEHQLPALAAKTSPEKLIVALKKSWGKMSEAGRATALGLDLGPESKRWIQKALQES